MPARIRDFLGCLLLFALVCVSGCSGCGQGIAPAPTSDGGGGNGGAGGRGGAGGDNGPCGVDCSQFETDPCMTAICNTGQVPGPLNTCIVVPAKKGTACDDGKFCTLDDACDNGTCVGQNPNECGMGHDACTSILCDEASRSCSATPVNDGSGCTPTEPCMDNGVCKLGKCLGEPLDCTFSPLNECNSVTCNPASGKCEGTPDPGKDNQLCVLSSDPCKVDKTCQNGQCVGGAPKDCSVLDAQCQIGVCDSVSGLCGLQLAPQGTACTDGTSECQVGSCDTQGACKAASAPDGVGCNDHDACTSADSCHIGACTGGVPVPGCVVYLKEGFEVCADGWTFAGDWQCGVPMSVGPPAAHSGKGVMATQIAGVYHVNQTFDMATATSPAVDLTTATNPMLYFWAWDDTEGGSYDGWNLAISVDGGGSFSEIPTATVTPAYPLVIASQPAYGGHHAADGWKSYSADLTAYIGKSVLLRWAFHSDAATVFPGVYVDDITVAEPVQSPLYITTTSPLPNAYVGSKTYDQITKIGGSSAAVWSILPGAINAAWLSIDRNTGVLTGTPSAQDVGRVSIVVHVEEQSLPSNFDDKTLNFDVKAAFYYTSFEGPCPGDWTLGGDWQCGVPTVVGPATAFVGTQCIGTQLAANYSDNQTFASCTATSPDIDLTTAPVPILSFRMWVDTEGGTFDGFTLQVSTDSGMSYSVISGVQPVYPLVINGVPSYGGHQGPLGWQLVQADLSAYTGHVVRLRFAFQSDDVGEAPGVYIDDILIN